MKQFMIHESNIERLQKKITRIRNKCAKFGCDFYYAEVGEDFKTFKKGTPDEHVERYIVVECEGTAKVNGWRFIGTVDKTEQGNLIRSTCEDVVVPERYRTSELECEHCHSARHRKSTYIIYNDDTKEFKQVGSSCLCDFTGGLSAEGTAEYIALFDELIKGEAPCEGYTYEKWFDIKKVLSYAVEIVNLVGYTSTTGWGESTRSRVADNYRYDDQSLWSKSDKKDVEDFRAKYHPDFERPEVVAEVEAILNYFLDNTEESDYMKNLKILAFAPYIRAKDLGYVVSMVPTYNKHMDKVRAAKKAEIEGQTSTHVATVGARVSFKIDSVTVVAGWYNDFGYTTRYKIVDDKGNVYMWDTSSTIYTEDRPDTLTGTVKKHDEFRGVKQTWLTRCKVTYAPKAPVDPEPGTFDEAEVFAMMDM